MNCTKLKHAHIHKHIYSHIYSYIHTLIYIPTDIDPYTCTYTYISHTYICTHIYHIHIYPHAYSHIHKEVYIHSLTYTEGLSVFIPGDMPNPNVCAHRHAHVHTLGDTHMLRLHIC